MLRSLKYMEREMDSFALLAFAWLAASAGNAIAGLVWVQWLGSAPAWWPALTVAGKLGLSIALIVLGAWDSKTGFIPNWGTMPLVGLGMVCLVVRLSFDRLPPDALRVVEIGWPLGLIFWQKNIFRGGDMKLCLALLAFFPDIRFVWLLIGVIFFGSILVIVRRQGWAGFRRVGAVIFTTLTGHFPTADEIEASYHRPGGSYHYGPLFSLAGLIFLWLF